MTWRGIVTLVVASLVFCGSWACSQPDSNNNNTNSNANTNNTNTEQPRPRPRVEPPKRSVSVTVSEDKTKQQTVSPRFLSFAVDTAQMAGGVFWDPKAENTSTAGSAKVDPYDFSRPKLRRLAQELSPAYIRIGGTAADETYYDLSDKPVTKPPNHYEWVLTKVMWDNFHDFVTKLNFRVLFTLNAGRGPRDKDDVWLPDNSRTLLKYAKSKKTPVDVWELGNEVNGFALLLGLKLDENGYTRDLKAAKKLLSEEFPEAKLAGPSCAFWPELGDFASFYSRFMPVGGKVLDIVTWHYYPQQSKRCPTAVRRATPELMMQPENLAELDKWADRVEKFKNEHAPNSTVWLGETGNAQCGGEPKVSNTFVGGFWWLDQLGRIARRGQKVVIRQTLSGSDYGLINDQTLKPNPDYWNSVLWKRLMGEKVMPVTLSSSNEKHLMAYAHCSAKPANAPTGSVTVLLLNVHLKDSIRVSLDNLKGSMNVYAVTSDALQSSKVMLNGKALVEEDDGAPPEIKADRQQPGGDKPYLDLGPRSYAFVVMPEANFSLCR